jgi:hypothetical protein
MRFQIKVPERASGLQPSPGGKKNCYENNKINAQQNECLRLQNGTKINEKENEYMERQVEADLCIMGIKKRHVKAIDRRQWRNIVLEATVQNGL